MIATYQQVMHNNNSIPSIPRFALTRAYTRTHTHEGAGVGTRVCALPNYKVWKVWKV